MADALPFTDHREAARALLRAALDGTGELRSREAQFVGGVAFDANPLSDKQAKWLSILLDKSGLPPLAGGDA